MRIRSSPLVLACILLACHPGLDGAETSVHNSVRDAAAGAQASLAEPLNGKLLNDPASEDDVFLEEYMNYQTALMKSWKLRLFASASIRHDSNVLLSTVNPESDVMWGFRPGFQYSLGDDQARLQLLADYSAQWNFFQNHSTQDSVNHFASTSLTWRASKTTLKIGGRFTDIFGGDLDVGGQAQRMQFSPDLQLIYEATEKVRVGLTGQMQKTHYDALLSSTVWRMGLFADYAFSPQFRLGMQFNEMLLDVEGSGRQHGEDVLLRVEWAAFEKLSLNGTAGVHLLRPSGAADRMLPSASLGLEYEIGPKTSLRVNVYAQATGSPSLQGQYFQSQGISVGLQQQVGTKLNVGMEAGYDLSEYGSYLSAVAANRTDRVCFIRPWLKYTLSRRLSLDVFYQFTNNDSSGTSARGFERRLLGAGITGSW